MKQARTARDLIDRLHIDFIGREIEAPHEMIREAYPLTDYRVSSYEDFKAIVVHYYQYHQAAWNGQKAEMSADMAYGQVRRLLRQTPRPEVRLSKARALLDKTQGGYKQAVKNALTGRHRGLIGVIDDIANGIREEAVEQWVRAVFLEALNPANWERRIHFAKDYLATFGRHVLPDEDLVSPYELAANLESAIEGHVRIINQFRTTLQ